MHNSVVITDGRARKVKGEEGVRWVTERRVRGIVELCTPRNIAPPRIAGRRVG